MLKFNPLIRYLLKKLIILSVFNQLWPISFYSTMTYQFLINYDLSVFIQLWPISFYSTMTYQFLFNYDLSVFLKECRCCDRMLVEFTTTCDFKPCSWQGVLDTTLCDKVCQWLTTSRWFSPCTLVSSFNKTDRLEITYSLLKVASNTIIPAVNFIAWCCIEYTSPEQGSNSH
jgi:hypothetical protein